MNERTEFLIERYRETSRVHRRAVWSSGFPLWCSSAFLFGTVPFSSGYFEPVGWAVARICGNVVLLASCLFLSRLLMRRAAEADRAAFYALIAHWESQIDVFREPWRSADEIEAAARECESIYAELRKMH